VRNPSSECSRHMDLVVQLRLHHVGVLVADIAAEVEHYIQRFGYQVRSAVIHDPVQSAFVQFVSLASDSVYVEFVSPDGPTSKLSNALRKGGGVNHLCYSTTCIDNAVQQLWETGMFVLQTPVPAVAFCGRKIAWLMGSDSVPIELVERGPDNEI
jgi:methylmalonyl-CoA/ethylmalonyl-CoA epimerase